MGAHDMTEDKRKQNEMEQGRKIAGVAEQIWQRDTRAGRRRVQNRFDHFRAWFADRKNVLEIGCGTGEWTAKLTELSFTTTSIDISPDLLSAARQKLPTMHFVEADGEALPFEKDAFDGICGLSVLHHLRMAPHLKELFRVLIPGGKIWFSEPNMLNPQIMIQKNIPLIKRWAGDTPDETAFFRWPLKRLLQDHGFTDVQVVPFDFLHPQTPDVALALVDRMGRILERIPLIREIAGSLRITAQKPHR